MENESVLLKLHRQFSNDEMYKLMKAEIEQWKANYKKIAAKLDSTTTRLEEINSELNVFKNPKRTDEEKKEFRKDQYVSELKQGMNSLEQKCKTLQAKVKALEKDGEIIPSRLSILPAIIVNDGVEYYFHLQKVDKELYIIGYVTDRNECLEDYELCWTTPKRLESKTKEAVEIYFKTSARNK